jgi:hypothetical protein
MSSRRVSHSEGEIGADMDVSLGRLHVQNVERLGIMKVGLVYPVRHWDGSSAVLKQPRE